MARSNRTFCLLAAIIIIVLGLLALNEVCYQAIKHFRRQEGVVVLLNTVRYLAAFFAFFLIGPLSSWIEVKYDNSVMSKRYGSDWWLLTEQEMHMIEIILLEERRKIFPAYSDARDPELHKEAKRRVSESKCRK
jgi:hypothetical protein